MRRPQPAHLGGQPAALALVDPSTLAHGYSGGILSTL